MLPAEELRPGIRIFERGVATSTLAGEGESGVADSPLSGLLGSLPAAQGEAGAPAEAVLTVQEWEEIDYTETSIFVQAAADLELDVVFVLDFTNSMALARLPDGRSGIEAMLDAMDRAIRGLPEAHRVAIVEFHDRNVDPRVLSFLTSEREAALASVDRFARSGFEPGSSRVWDSIDTAASLFTSGIEKPNAVRSIVFVSDGRDTSSITTRSDAGGVAADGGIQLYALGIGEVYEEEELAELARSTGGVYYPIKELEELEDQPRQLITDLLGQYRVSYITLRREGLYEMMIEVDMPLAIGSFESQALDVGSFFGLDSEGTIAIDPSVLGPDGTAVATVRALTVPRNIRTLRFRVLTDKPVDVDLVSPEEGGLLDGWELSGRDAQGYYQATGPEPIDFGDAGALFRVTISEFTEQRLQVPVVFDSSVYSGGRFFTQPLPILLGQQVSPSGRIAFQSNRSQASSAVLMEVDGADQRPLEGTPGEAFSPTLSADGAWIAFEAASGLSRDIFTMEVGRQSEPTNVTSHPAKDSRPAWSPGGDHIAFDSDRGDGLDVYVTSLESGGVTRLTSDLANDWWPAWSPDGSRIAFTSNREDIRHEPDDHADGRPRRDRADQPYQAPSGRFPPRMVSR